MWMIVRGAVHALPGDPVEYLVHESLVSISPEELRARMNLDQPVIERIFSLPQSRSLITGHPITPICIQAFFRTLELSFLTLVLGTAFTLLLLYGSFLSWRVKKIAEFYSIASASTPLFVLGPLVLLVFSIHLGWFPVTHHIFLPALTLSITLSSFWYRTLSRKIYATENSSSATGARARGVSETGVFFRYLLFPSLGTFMSFLGTQIGTLLNGSVLVEIIFQWRGLGMLLSDAVSSRDYPVIEVSLMLATALTLLSQQMGYILQRQVEPRLK